MRLGRNLPMQIIDPFEQKPNTGLLFGLRAKLDV
jgi:hypothetical protein